MPDNQPLPNHVHEYLLLRTHARAGRRKVDFFCRLCLYMVEVDITDEGEVML